MLKHKLKLCHKAIGLGFVYLPEIVFTFLPINLDMCFGCSREASHLDGSFEHPQHMFVLSAQRSRVIEKVLSSTLN